MRHIMTILAAAALVCACGTTARTPESQEDKAARKAVNQELRREAMLRAQEEEVGIGYETIRKDQNTYSVERVTPDEKQMSGYRSIIDYLRGRVPGLMIGATDGTTMPSITIRGKNSINSGTQPLFIVDGAPYEDIMWVNPHDVASVDVLKDGSAAIYGSRGANGVIIISTKTARDEAAAERKLKKEQTAAQKAARKAAKKSTP